MSSIEEIRNDRLKKLSLLKEQGIDPYPIGSERTHFANQALEDFEELLSTEAQICVAGRIMSLRSHGGSTFLDLFDGTAKIQGYLKADEVGEESYQLFVDAVDIGDFIEIKGKAFKTKKEVPTILADSWRMLSKSLRPLPGEYYGFKDEEERLRKRYLDILMNPEIRELLEKKALFWDTVRAFLKQRNFIEVETPTLEVTTGGAEANPFKTYHRDFDLDVFLRISVGELWQKKLMAAGLPKTFEIGRVYRNEGSSPEHVQEFTNMEFYAAYMSFEEGKELIKSLYREIAQKVFGTAKFEAKGHSFDLNSEWEDLDYVETIKKMTSVDILEASDEALKNKLKELKVEFQGENRERMMDSLWKYCRKQISGPAFLINHPKLIAPLSKEHPDDPRLTKTFQPIIAGSEVGRAHAELNDPLDQKERFEIQQKLLEGGDEEAMMPDWDFVEMLEHGMPPTFGFGFGERFFAYLAGKPVREAQTFPLMKPKS